MTVRVAPLEGGRNFRDLGGYRAAGGRTVRWGQVFRSGALSGLTDADCRKLAEIGVSVICDFRATSERDAEPVRWTVEPAPQIRVRDYEMQAGHIRQAVAEAERTADTMVLAMRGFYTDIPYSHADSYRMLFGELLAGRTPLVFNCSAGKDRAGVGAALVLTALGVDRADIVEDYSLSDQVFDFEALATASESSETATGFAAVARYPREIRSPMLRSDPTYLEAAFAAIEQRDGTVERYMETHLGVGPREAAALQDMLLEAPT